MAENAEKKVLISVEILDNFIKAKGNVDFWKAALKDAQKTGAATQKELREIAAELAKANNEYRDAKKDLESVTKAQELLDSASSKTNKTLGEMRRELTALRNTPFDGLSEEEIAKVEQAMANLVDEIDKYNTKIKGMDTGEIWKNAASNIEVVAASASALTNITKVLGVESDGVLGKLQEKTTELIAIVQAMGVVTDYLSKKKGQLLLMNIKSIITTTQETIAKKLNTLETQRQAKAETMSAAAKLKNAVATKLLTVAQWLLNAAMAANPVFLIISGLILLIGAVIALTGVLSKSAQAEKAAAQASEAYEKQAQKTADTIATINRNEADVSNRRKNRLREEILEMQKNGATSEEIAKVRARAEQDLRDISIQATEERITAQKDELKSSEENYKAQVRHLDTLKEGSKKYKEQKQKVDDLRKSHLELAQTIKGEQQTIIDLNLQSKEALQKQKEDTQKANDDRRKQYQDNALKTLDMQKKFQDEQFKFQDAFQKKDFLSQQKWEAEKFTASQKYEKDKAKMQRDFALSEKNLTAEQIKMINAQYENQIKTLEVQQKTFQTNQLNGLENYYKEQQAEVLKLIGEDTDLQIESVKKKYADALKDIQDMPAPKRMSDESDEDFGKRYNEYKNFMLNKAAYEKQIEEAQAKEIQKIRESYLAKQIADIEQIVQDQYKGDLAKFTDNEREKNRIEIEMLEKQIAEKKAKGLEVYEDEADLRAAKNQAVQLQLNSELLLANNNAQAIYEAKKAALEKEKKLYEDNKDKQLEIAKQLADNEKELIESRIAQFEEWSGKTMELLSAVSALASANEEAEIQKSEEANEKKKAVLQERLDKGLISQKEYDKQVAASDAELDKKKAETARKQAVRERLIKVFEIGLNTASAIMKGISMFGPPPSPMGIASIASASILGAVQLATVLAAPLPKAKRGMLLRGKSHAQGGIPIEAEDGEVIINKASSRMFLPLLSKINEAGGGIPFVPKFQDGGYASRNLTSGIRVYQDGGEAKTVGITKEEMAEVMKEMKVAVAVEDIRRGDDNYTEVTEISNFN